MLDCNNNTDGLWGCGYYASLSYGYDRSHSVDRRGLAQLPFYKGKIFFSSRRETLIVISSVYKGNFEFIEREIDRRNELYVDDVYGNYENEDYVEEENCRRIKTRKRTLPKLNPNVKKTILKTKWNKNSKKKKSCSLQRLSTSY